jgi:hypothetical protein
MGELTAWQTAYIAKMVTGEDLGVEDINPYRRPTKPKPISEFQNKLGWSLMFKGILGVDPTEKKADG